MGMYPDMYDIMGDMGQLENTVLAVLGVYLVIMLISSIYSIVVYVLQSLGFYSIAKRRGIHNPWLAWIPVANLWVLGSISDHYQYIAKNKKTSRRKILIGLTIALYVVAIVLGIVLGLIISIAAISGAPERAVVLLVILVLAYLVLLVLAIILTVFQYIAFNDLFTSCNPNNATAFLVLSIFFSFLLPYFVFACRKKDLGMPVPQQPVQPEAPKYIPAPETVEEAPAEPTADEADFEPEE